MEDVFVVGLVSKKPLVDGSKSFGCLDCKRKVWLSPASQKVLAEKSGKVLCMDCVKKKKQKMVFKITSEQLSEVVTELSKKNFYRRSS